MVGGKLSGWGACVLVRRRFVVEEKCREAAISFETTIHFNIKTLSRTHKSIPFSLTSLRHCFRCASDRPRQRCDNKPHRCRRTHACVHFTLTRTHNAHPHHHLWISKRVYMSMSLPFGMVKSPDLIDAVKRSLKTHRQYFNHHHRHTRTVSSGTPAFLRKRTPIVFPGHKFLFRNLSRAIADGICIVLMHTRGSHINARSLKPRHTHIL